MFWETLDKITIAFAFFQLLTTVWVLFKVYAIEEDIEDIDDDISDLS